MLTRDETLKLIEETYPGQLEITDNKRFSDWQTAKKIYQVTLLLTGIVPPFLLLKLYGALLSKKMGVHLER